ncbi:hypothetical protein ACFY5D_04525 [Paeniglutamicibacter sp. NPDC012692]|uniref:hypothetical protein n=1 Tax=Paeniglutamicibacter sp. NPDC012692 TaxID=3364388 RepID=UPI0036C0E989
MDGLQSWHLVVLAILVIIGVVAYLLYGYFFGARKRQGRRNAPPAERRAHDDELD